MTKFETFGGEWDKRTITAAGEPVHRVIDGVLTRSCVTHVDHRGRLFEVMNSADTEFWAQPVVHSYVFTIRTHTVKGWGVHEVKSDRYCLIDGECMTILYDARPDSPTYGLVQEVPLSPEGTRQVLIPPGVWHMNVNIAPQETVLVNFPTEPYSYENPDRITLPWHTPHIPVDVASYFPRQIHPAPRD
jgi:dTDP-4-dehydrorhamnose 3,5-epimerase